MRTKNHNKLLFIFLALLLVNLACGIENESNLETAAAETVAVELTHMADQSLSISATESVTEPDTPVPSIISTSIPTGTPIPTSTTTPTDEAPCDVASFISDVTVPDGSDFIPGENFTKTWRLKNVGTCTWTTAYDLVFFDGDQMGGPVSQPLIDSGSVAPNQSVDISVDLTAPGSEGNYTGYWKLRNASNVIFELSNGDPFYVEIDVIEPTATPEILIEFIPIFPPIILFGPDFSANFAEKYTCFLTPRASFQIENTGTLNIESMQITIEGPIGSQVHQSTQNMPFVASSTMSFPCLSLGAEYLADGETRYVHATLDSLPLPGVMGQATIKMCGLDDLGGFCTEKTINFIW